jgi:hypothetical protein
VGWRHRGGDDAIERNDRASILAGEFNIIICKGHTRGEWKWARSIQVCAKRGSSNRHQVGERQYHSNTGGYKDK